MPALSDTMSVGRLAKWLKKPGDQVNKGEAIAEVETDKAVMEVEAFYDGYLAGPLAPLDADLPLGAPIAYIADNLAEATSIAVPEAPAAATAVAAAASASPSRSAATTSTAQSSAVGASPYARALAHSLGVDLASVATRRSGPIDAAELLKAVARTSSPGLEEGPPYRLERPSSLRESVARTMIASAATPTFRVTAELPLEPLHKFAREKNFSLTLLLARVCALTIKTYPVFNAVYTPEGVAQRERVDIGVAVDVPEGLITPVLRDVALRPLSELAKDWDVLREKVKTRRLATQDYRGATFYLSDLGVFPVVRSFDSIIPLGAAAILSVAAAMEDAAAFTLSCDHRIIFGADAARFLTGLSEWLSNPGRLGG